MYKVSACRHLYKKRDIKMIVIHCMVIVQFIQQKKLSEREPETYNQLLVALPREFIQVLHMSS